MKYLIITFSLLLFVSCQQNTSEPMTVKFKSYENPTLTLFKLVKNNPYNKNGYLLLVDEEDEYGHTQWVKWGPVFKFGPNVVSELKKYNTVEDFEYSDFGSGIREQMSTCHKNDVEICSIK